MDPRDITQDELNVELFLCQQNIDALVKKAPALRRQHLKDSHRKVQLKGNTDKATAILKILHREASRKHWRRANRSTGRARGHQATSVKVPLPTASPDEAEQQYDEFREILSCLLCPSV